MADPNPQELEAFMAAIRDQESGSPEGNYTIVNGDSGAYGAYQFMRETYRNAARLAGIRTLRWPPPREDQDRAARALMTQYFQKYGSWQNVAISWYAGPGAVSYSQSALNRPQYSNGREYPSINEYAASIVQKAQDFAKQGVDKVNQGGAGNWTGVPVNGGLGSVSEDAAEQGAFAGTRVRQPDDPLGSLSGGPGTVFGGGGGGGGAGTAPIIPLENGGELDLNDAEAVQSEVEARYGDIEDNEEFLRRVYSDVLGREPDEQGLAFWLGQLDSGVSRGDVYRGFYASEEGGETEPPLLSEVEQMIRSTYPDWAWAMNNDEVREILLEAVDPARGLDDATFRSRIRQTEWWKNTQSSVRVWDAESSMDPAESQRRIERKALEIQRRAVTLGSNIRQEDLMDLAERALRFNLSDTEINDALAARFDAEDPRGNVAANLRTARDTAQRYMVNVDDAEMVRWAQDVAIGKASQDDFNTRIAELARAKFSQNQHLMKLIDAGVAPSTYFNDHKRMVANELDLSPEQVDLMDPRYARILSSAMDGSVRPMDLDETRQHIRNNAEFGWSTTSTGRAKIAQTALSLARAFGKVA